MNLKNSIQSRYKNALNKCTGKKVIVKQNKNDSIPRTSEIVYVCLHIVG